MSSSEQLQLNVQCLGPVLDQLLTNFILRSWYVLRVYVLLRAQILTSSGVFSDRIHGEQGGCDAYRLSAEDYASDDAGKNMLINE